jgi:diguanylate cyclase (GGDEF)-like protein
MIIVFSNINLLILHSYSSDYDWTNELNRGIEDILKDKDITYHTEYIDAKTKFSPVYIQNYQNMLETKYKNVKFDLIISTDQEAYEFIHILGKKTFGDFYHAFVGVENINREYLNKYPKTFGLYGDVEIRRTINQALINHKDIKNIISVFSSNIIGGNYSEEIKSEQGYFFDKKIITLHAQNTKDAIQKINQIDESSIVLIGNVMRDENNNLITLEEAAVIISNSVIHPPYALWSNQIGNGTIGGYVSNPYRQGKQIAELSLKKLNGEKIEQFTYKNFYHMYDYNILKKYNIPLTQLPKDSIIINKPTLADSLVEILYITIVLAILLVIVIIVFTRYTLKLRKEKKEVEMESMQDTLTKVYNRRYLEKTEKDWVEEIVIVFIFDLDYLKEINDNHGHDVGDRYIIKAAEVLKKTFRKQDIISRIGGDEFVALIKTKPEEQEHAVRRILYTLELNIRSINRDLSPKLSISYGYAVKEVSFEEALKEADKKMYENKKMKKRK